MSNIGKKPIQLPSEYTIVQKEYTNFKQIIITINKIKKYINIPKNYTLKIKEKKLYLETTTKEKFYGTLNRKLEQMLTQKFRRQIRLDGIGYKLELKGDEVVSDIGYSHKLHYKIPKNIKIKEVGTNILEGESDSLEELMSFLSKIWIIKKSKKDKYKGKGYTIMKV